jgi:hypothetical protein
MAWAGAVLVLSLSASGCTAETAVAEAQSPDCAAAGECTADPTTDGEDPASFCDDHNPCTDDVNCTPCSALEPPDRNIHRCTADADLPALCAGRTGCVHEPLTTPAGQIDDCFPVAGAADLHAGVCRAGRCAENDE